MPSAIGRAADREVDRRQARAARVAGVGEELPGARPDRAPAASSASPAPGMPGGTMLVAGLEPPNAPRPDDALPVHGGAERLADPDVVERRRRRVEAEVRQRERRRLAELRPEVAVVRHPRRVDRRDLRVVEVAGLELGDRAAAARGRGRGGRSGSPAGRPSSSSLRWSDDLGVVGARDGVPAAHHARPARSAALPVAPRGRAGRPRTAATRRSPGSPRRAAPAPPRRRCRSPAARPWPGPFRAEAR